MADEEGGNAREQDRFLPIANISRIMKKSLPNNAKIAKDAKETVQECVSEFISFITSEASDKCQREKRKTINGDDLLWAMQTLGFDEYIEPLRVYLARFREAEQAALAKPIAAATAGEVILKKEPLPSSKVGVPVQPPPATQQQQQAPPQMFPGMPGQPGLQGMAGMFPPGLLGSMGLPQGMQQFMPGAGVVGALAAAPAPAP